VSRTARRARSVRCRARVARRARTPQSPLLLPARTSQ
jgi:hypothetical protein